MVERLGLGQREGRGVVARAELDQRGGQDGAFEVQMQLGLGEAADERGNIVHEFSLKGAFQARGIPPAEETSAQRQGWLARLTPLVLQL